MPTRLVTILTVALALGVSLPSAASQDFHIEKLLIAPGDVVSGVLDPSDNVMTSDDTYFDVYILPVVSGRTYRISMDSGDFDTYLMLSDFVTGETAEDDDSGPDTNSALTVTAEGSGFFVVGANSLLQNTGRYTLNVEELVLSAK